MQTQTLIEKINNLSEENLVKVEDFVDFLLEKAKRPVEKSNFQEIVDYAEKHAGSEVDSIDLAYLIRS